MDPVTIISVLALVIGLPAAFFAFKQLFHKKPTEPAQVESPPKPPIAPRPKLSPTGEFQLGNLPTPHSEHLIGREDEKELLTREWNNRERRNVLAIVSRRVV